MKKLADEIGIDYNTDTYDAGLHLNLSGAEKLSKYFGKYLTDDLRPDRLPGGSGIQAGL